MDQVTSRATEIAAANRTHNGSSLCPASPSALPWLDARRSSCQLRHRHVGLLRLINTRYKRSMHRILDQPHVDPGHQPARCPPGSACASSIVPSPGDVPGVEGRRRKIRRRPDLLRRQLDQRPRRCPPPTPPRARPRSGLITNRELIVPGLAQIELDPHVQDRHDDAAQVHHAP